MVGAIWGLARPNHREEYLDLEDGVATGFSLFARW
jgi:hypothetical protein